jgi:hypothetical protein
MAIEVLLIREGSKLGAADSLSAELIAGIKAHETVTATIRRPRSRGHHRTLFALMKVVFEAQNTFATIDQLLGALKLSIGLFDTGLTIDKVPYVVPRSISFTAMDQNQFTILYDKMVDVILTKILPAVSRADLEAQIQEILDGYGR